MRQQWAVKEPRLMNKGKPAGRMLRCRSGWDGSFRGMMASIPSRASSFSCRVFAGKLQDPGGRVPQTAAMVPNMNRRESIRANPAFAMISASSSGVLKDSVDRDR